MKLTQLPFGTVVRYRKKNYWVSNGLDRPIVTDVNGMWCFIDELKWKKWTVVLMGNS